MSLATRCTACGTVFRVVQDQLRVSEGWVRCGRCAEVFNAQEQVFDIETEPPPPWPPELSARSTAAAQPLATEADPYDEEFAAPVAPRETRPPEHVAATPAHTDSQLPRPSRFSDDAAIAAPAPSASHEDSRREPEWGEPSKLDALDQEPALDRPSQHADEPSLAADPVVEPPPVSAQAAAKPTLAADTTPSFMRPSRPRSAKGWGGPASRIALYGLAFLLSVSLLLQAVHHFRDAMAALLPGTAPALQAMCKVLDCDLQPWRRIDAVSVETSALTHAGSGNNYQLSLTLRNKSGVDVASPWVDLSLTDSSGALVARRMISPKQLTPSKTVLQAGSDLALEVLISTGSQNVTGYSVEIFHP